jgi:diguanylate cyclase (GGDEF)-like protein
MGRSFAADGRKQIVSSKVTPMTLYRQLIIFTLILFLLLFAGSWYAKLESTRSFLADQLESHAQDTATSLGLSISQYIQDIEQDLPIAESMISAVFDRGYYRFIKLVDTHQAVLINLVLDVKIENVPDWFIQMFPIDTPEASANVMTGWIQAGTVHVESHPGYAYKTLWEDTVRMTWWFLACGVFVIIVGGIGLRFLLRPLVMVEQQADALCRKEYRIQERIPWTKELRRMVEAMNRMTVKVKEMFEEQVVHAESLREHAYHDDLTGLGNRRYFASQITARLDRRGGAAKGVVLLIQVHELERLNKERGFAAGDALLKRVADLLREATATHANAVLAHLEGGDFGIYLPDTPPWEAESIASNIAENLARLVAEDITLTDNVGHVGASTYEVSTTLARLLSEADLALRTAILAGPNAWSVRAITEEAEKMPLGEQQWKVSLEKALQERSVTLAAQPVVKTGDRDQLLHLEIFSRIVQEDGKLLSAGVFLPFAEQLGLVSALDRLVLEQLKALDARHLGVTWVAVNVSPTSLRDDAFRQWVKSFLNNLPATAPRIIFEFTEFGAVHSLDLVKAFRAGVKDKGHALGLDHYGQSFSHLGYLQSLHPDYVKIDRAYTGELKDEESDSRFFIGSLCSVAHSIDIAVIAEGVETEQQFEVLKALHIDGIQGYLIDKPRPLEEVGKTDQVR